MKSKGVPAQYLAPQPRVPVPGKQVPITFGSEDWECQAFLLKSPHKDFLDTLPLSSSSGQQLERNQEHSGRNWIVWLQGKSWGRSFLTDKSTGRDHCSFAEPYVRTNTWVPYLSLLNLANTVVFTWWFPEIHPPHLWDYPSHTNWLFHTACLGSCFEISYKFLKQAVSGLSKPHKPC